MPTSKTPLILGLLLLVSILITVGIYSWQNKQITELNTTIENLEASLDVANKATTPPSPTPKPTPVVIEENKDELEDTNATDDSTLKLEDTTATDDNTLKEEEAKDTENKDTPTDNQDILPDFTAIGTTYTIKEGSDLLDDTTRSMLQERGEEIQGRYMAVSPTNPRIFYFATSQSKDDTITTSRVYKYDAERDKLIELYWQRNNKPLWIWGLDGNELLVHEITPSQETNACFNPWLSNNMQSLNLEAPSEGIDPYQVDQKIINREKSSLSGC